MPRQPSKRKAKTTVDEVCIKCKTANKYNDWLGCDSCLGWLHPQCFGISRKTYEDLRTENNESYHCPPCQAEQSTSKSTRKLPKSRASGEPSTNSRQPKKKSAPQTTKINQDGQNQYVELDETGERDISREEFETVTHEVVESDCAVCKGCKNFKSKFFCTGSCKLQFHYKCLNYWEWHENVETIKCPECEEKAKEDRVTQPLQSSTLNDNINHPEESSRSPERAQELGMTMDNLKELGTLTSDQTTDLRSTESESEDKTQLDQLYNQKQTHNKLQQHIAIMNTSNRNNDQEPTTSKSIPEKENLSSKLPETNLEPTQDKSTGNTTVIDSETESDNETDDDGYKEVEKIVKHNQHYTKVGQRQFQLKYKNQRKLGWVWEKDCDGCVDMVNKYCRDNGLKPTNLRYKKGAGSTSRRSIYQEQWKHLEEILQKTKTYGHKNLLQPEIFVKLDSKDGIYLKQIGNHCFAILYYHDTRNAYVADGENVLFKDKVARDIMFGCLRIDGKPCRSVTYLEFDGQREKDKCATSAAAIAIEFQRIHQYKLHPTKLTVPAYLLDTVGKYLNPGSTEKIKSWTSIHEKSWKISCDKCGKHFNTKSRTALNFHKC